VGKTRRPEFSREELLSVVEGIADGISIQALDYTVLYQNPAHIAMIGYHVGEKCYRAYESNTSVCEGCPVREVFETGRTHSVIKSSQFHGTRRYIQINASPLKDASGKVIGGIESVRDITPQVAARDELQQ